MRETEGSTVTTSVAMRIVRWLPFVAMAAVSLWVAAGLPNARKPFHVNVDLSAQTVVQSVVKVKHYEGTALFFFLGVVALGTRNARVPFLLATGLGVAWELAEATGVRHTARVADLAPDLIAAVACSVVLVGARRLFVTMGTAPDRSSGE